MKYRSGYNQKVIDALKHKKDKIKIGSPRFEKKGKVQKKDQGKTEGDQGPSEYLMRDVFK